MGAEQLIIGLPPNTFTILMLMAGIIIVLVVIIYLIKYIIDNAPFAYVNARVRSMESRLLNEHKYGELIESGSLVELIGFLEDTEYGKYLSDSENIEGVEKALYSHLASVYTSLANMAPEKGRKILKLFEKKFDIYNIKSILRAKYFGLSYEETYKLIVPLGTIPENKLRDLCECKTVEEVVNSLEGTEYHKILSSAMSEYEQTGKLTELELSLDKYILENLWKAVSIEGVAEDIFKEYIGAMVDIENLKIILRCKADGVPSEEISKYLLNDGYELASWKLKELSESDSIESIVSALEGTKYSQIISENLEEYEKTKSVYVFERALDRYILNIGKKLSLRQPFGVGPIIGLITAKEQEIQNLKIIIKCKIENIPSNQIRELLKY